MRAPQARTACYYPELGDDLAVIACEDQREAMDPRCADKPCVDGLVQACCATPAPQPAMYIATGYSDSVLIWRQSPTIGVTSFYFSLLDSGTNGWPLEVPNGWGENFASQEGENWQAIGALGRAALGEGPDCTLDLDFTLFFVTESGPVEPVRFKASGLVIENISPCPL